VGRTRRQGAQAALPASNTARTVSSGDQPRGFAGLSGMILLSLFESLLNIQQQLSPEKILEVGGQVRQLEL
jgi:hypothetical protein